MKTTLFAILALVGSAAFAAPQPPNPYNQQLAKLPDLQRRAVFRRAVLDSGQRCKRVDKSLQQGGYRNLIMWTVRCAAPGGDYGVFVGPDGSVQVRPCRDLKGLKLPVCAKL